MKAIFADSFFFFAILNRSDPQHEKAIAYSRNLQAIRVTTDWVLTELGDGLSRHQERECFIDLYRHILSSPAIKVVPASRSLFEAGINFYESRSDKDWTLTDCISFIVMRDEGISRALTGDKHFEQAGFTALLK
jgi:hypothetical protein